MKTTQQGQEAEAAVAEKLSDQGYKIIAQNWRTPRCEIDIIAQKDGVIYFVEVKYRSSEFQGSGLEYITKRKLKQLKFAGKIWIQQQGWEGDWRLLAASVTNDGENYLVEDIVELS